MLRVRLVVCIMLMLLMATAVVGQTPEFRSMQVDSWHSGFESATATTTMVNYASSCNLNCIMPEVRLRADAYYNSSIEPPGTGIAVSPAGFDSLADCITKAHAVGIEVHPWCVTFRIWSTNTGPGVHYSPIDHLWWTHGPGNTDPDQDWVMYSDTGAWDYGGIVNLDPGHPAVEDYLISVFMDIVNNYDVDGLNIDYIRYPSTSWGYNPVSVQRFNAEYGRTGNPSSADATWQQWRRDQVSNLVKRLYLEIKSVKPQVKLSADVWNSWSTGNSSYLQDWNAWLQNHFIDFVHPMTYTATNSTYTSWLDDAINRQNGRHIYPLVDVSNSITSNVLPQITDVRNHGFSGLGLYSYYVIPDKTALQTALVGGPFPSAVATPGMPWLDTPTLGMLKGYILTSGGYAVYPATVTIQSKSTKNTGTGFYGFVDLSTGTYTVSVTAPGYVPNSGQVTISAGQVANLNVTLTADTTPPTVSNVRTANVQATNAQILWDTSENADSQVEYGLTASYGSSTTLDPAAVTAHAVQLTGLTRTTLYHYRVKSKDPAGNLTTSGDYTFTTVSVDTPADIIIDNTSAALVGSWTTGTSATDKYGANYYYTSTAASETKSAKWTPSIISAGNYDVYVWYPQGANRSTMAPYTVYWNGGSATYPVNQTATGGQWVKIASAKPFLVGTAGYVKLGNGTGETSLNVMADAVKFAYVAGDTTAPTVPTNLAATAMSTSRIDLTWTASTDDVGVTGYKIYRNGSYLTSVTGTSFSDTGLTQYTAYNYRVSAYDAASNESAQSTQASATTWDGQAPTVPTGLTATATSPSRISLSWTASTDNAGVTGYKIYRAGVYLTSVATTSYTDTGRSPSTNYSYTVSAYDAASNESAQSTSANATTPALATIIIDNPAAAYTGTWTTATASTDKYGTDYRWVSTAASETATAKWTPTIAYPGNYSVYVWYPQGSNRATNSPFTTYWDGSSASTAVNQTAAGGTWVLIQTSRHFLAGTAGYVKLSNNTGATGKVVAADAVKFVQTSSD
jgi:uncharacterized lipoprotein YddW (UPF0748 family)/chitodextrinase